MLWNFFSPIIALIVGVAVGVAAQGDISSTTPAVPALISTFGCMGEIEACTADYIMSDISVDSVEEYKQCLNLIDCTGDIDGQAVLDEMKSLVDQIMELSEPQQYDDMPSAGTSLSSLRHLIGLSTVVTMATLMTWAST